MMVCGALSEMARDLFFHGSRKPSREFFARIVQISGVTPREIAHVATAWTMMCCPPKPLEW
jgi:hypothetical protein